MNYRKLNYGCPEVPLSDIKPTILPSSPLCPGESEAPPSAHYSRIPPRDSSYNASGPSRHHTPPPSHSHISREDVVDGAILVVNVVQAVHTVVHVGVAVVNVIGAVAGALG